MAMPLARPLISPTSATLASCLPRSPKDGGRLMARIESGAAAVTASRWDGAVMVAAGREPFELIQRGVAAAARLSGVQPGLLAGRAGTAACGC